MVVAPNTIDWSAISLDNLLSNPIVFAVVMSFILLYFILLIPARRQDKKDLEKVLSSAFVVVQRSSEAPSNIVIPNAYLFSL